MFVFIFILITDIEYHSSIVYHGKESHGGNPRTCFTLEFPNHTLGLDVILSNIQPNG